MNMLSNGGFWRRFTGLILIAGWMGLLSPNPLKAESSTPVHPHERVTLSFTGPETSEDAADNPFTNYRLLVHLRVEAADQPTTETPIIAIRGFYAADGDAANTGADRGNVWQCYFAPPQTGKWSYRAELRRGDWIAIDPDPEAGEKVDLQQADGVIDVVAAESTDNANQIHRQGRLQTDGHYFRFSDSGASWLKAGTNSPENLLGYADFDNTYRIEKNQRDGEAKVTDQLHRFQPHLRDWKSGDPSWRDGRGKSLIGAINYLSSTGMNAIYFLTMNIGGDGKDVWPYIDSNQRNRFDCSKLDQWEIVFEHMQQRGMQIHVITQETENERLLDDGDTGKYRKLYYSELIARFAHHPAIAWNVGEENGPANFSPHGQTPVQEKAMADYLKSADPYGNPVLIHSHASNAGQDHVLTPLLGHPTYDGVSLQVGKPSMVHDRIKHWWQMSDNAKHPWIVSMDEIGAADRGAVPDDVDPQHDEMRGPVLWGSLMAGAAGVEWYFGYKQAHNDLNAEDWRSRETLWKQTKHALDFFHQYLPYDKMVPADDAVHGGKAWCLAKPGETYAIYRPASQPEAKLQIDLSDATGKFDVHWFDPRHGGILQSSGVNQIEAGQVQALGMPPADPQQDWVVLVNRSKSPQCYRIASYLIGPDGDADAVESYLSDAVLPALNRQSIHPVGLFTDADPESPDDRRVVLVVPFETEVDLLKTMKAIEGDEVFRNDAREYLSRAHDDPAFARIESELLVAMDCMPELKVPDGILENAERVYELRVYESANERLGHLKVDMFNSGEVPIFLDSGIIPLFIGQSVVGPQNPNLTYLTYYPSDAERLKAWDRFRNHPDWKVLSAEAKYQNTVSHIDKYILRALPKSQM